MKVTFEISGEARKAVIAAIKTELSFFEDNVYRHVHLGGSAETDPVVIAHRSTIAHLKEALQALDA